MSPKPNKGEHLQYHKFRQWFSMIFRPTQHDFNYQKLWKMKIYLEYFGMFWGSEWGCRGPGYMIHGPLGWVRWIREKGLG